MYIHVCPCIYMYTFVYLCNIMYIHVQPCISMYTRVYPCISIYSHVCPCIPMYTHVLSCISMYSHVYPCIPVYIRIQPCISYNTIQHSLFNEGNVINPMSYLTYDLHNGTKYTYKTMPNQQYTTYYNRN